MYHISYEDHDPGEDIRHCLQSAYDRQGTTLLPRRMAELLEQLKESTGTPRD